MLTSIPTQAQKDAIRHLLYLDNIKLDRRYEENWNDAFKAAAKAAYKAAKTSLVHLHNSNYEKFQSLQCPDLEYGGPPFPDSSFSPCDRKSHQRISAHSE